MASSFYRRPYLDSGVFIGWIKGEVVREKGPDGKDVQIDRGKIGESVLTLAENRHGLYRIHYLVTVSLGNVTHARARVLLKHAHEVQIPRRNHLSVALWWAAR